VRKIVCPACRVAFERPLAALKANESVTCPTCGKAFQVRRYKSQAVAAAAFKKLTGFSSDPKGS